jgi:ABC-type transport system involved in multi-copper enzyme maturation permease subunit
MMTAAVHVTEESDTEVVHPRARLGRYALWQLRDYAFGAGGASLALSALAAAVLSGVRFGNDHHSASVGVASFLLSAFGFLGPIFATSGLVADDRSKGYYRFALAKPVRAVALYAQAFAVRGVAFVGMGLILWALAALLIGPIPLGGTVALLAMCYVTIGGMTFLLSTRFRNAWLGSLVLGAASAMAAAGIDTVGAPLWVKAVHALLPPYFLVADLSRVLLWGFDGKRYLAQAIAWFVGYGALALGTALVVIRRREWPL